MHKIVWLCLSFFFIQGCSSESPFSQEHRKQVQSEKAESSHYQLDRDAAAAAASETHPDAVAMVEQAALAEANKFTDSKIWDEEIEVSRMEDSKNVYLTLSANDTYNDWVNNATRPKMLFRCKEGKTDLILNIGSPFEPTIDYGVQTIKLRFDKEKVQILKLRESSNDQVSFFSNPIRNIHKMLTSETVHVEFSPYNQGLVVSTFHLTELKDRIKNLRQSCKW